MADRTIPEYPLFELYSLDALEGRLGYSVEYLIDVRAGRKPLTRRFRKTACGILRKSEAALFGEEEAR